jgi:hypothetical protein
MNPNVGIKQIRSLHLREGTFCQPLTLLRCSHLITTVGLFFCGRDESYNRLPEEIRAVADRSHQLLKDDPNHPSLQFKLIGKICSVRVGLLYRAIATPRDGGYLRGFGLDITLNTTCSSANFVSLAEDLTVHSMLM